MVLPDLLVTRSSMLKLAESNRVTGAGFEVRVLFATYCVEYREGARRLLFSAEFGAFGNAALVFDFPDARHWQPPYEEDILPDAHKHLILVRVTAAMRLVGTAPDWIADFPPRDRSDWVEIMAKANAMLEVTAPDVATTCNP